MLDRPRLRLARKFLRNPRPRRFQRHRLFHNLEHLAHLVWRDLHLGRNLFGRRFPSQLLHEVLLLHVQRTAPDESVIVPLDVMM